MRTAWQVVGLTLALGAATLGGVASAGGAGSSPPPDAFTVYDATARLLRTHYVGPNMGQVGGLLTAERKRLVSRCQSSAPCPLWQGRAAVDAVLSSLGDGHTAVRWESPSLAELAEAERRLPQTRVWSGMLTQLLTPSEVQVVHVDHGSPAERAGVRPGDVMLAVGGQDDLDDAGLRSSFLEAAQEAGKPFALRVRRGQATHTLTVTPAPWSAWGQPSLRWDGRVAIISVPSFGRGSGAAFNTLVTRAITQGATGLVVDVRWNPGGGATECLSAAHSLAGDAVNIVGIGRSGRALDEWRTTAEAQLARSRTQVRWEGPLALLVSEATYSCGELLAFFGQRAGGTVVGSPTGGLLTSRVMGFDPPGWPRGMAECPRRLDGGQVRSREGRVTVGEVAPPLRPKRQARLLGVDTSPEAGFTALP